MKKVYEEELARKILRYLPKKFDMKVTAIEEAQDISSIKVDDLIGSLLTFEMAINVKKLKRIVNVLLSKLRWKMTRRKR